VKTREKIIGLFSLLVIIAMMTGCTWVPRNNLPLYQRSVVIEDQEMVAQILSKASLVESNDPEVNNIKVLHLSGTPYEMGFQHERLIKDDVRANVHNIIGLAKRFASEDIMDEVYDLMAPYIPREDQEEMRGLAHGADIPLRVIHWLHAIPEVSEYGPKRQFVRSLKGTSCSNLAAFGSATEGGELYQLRVLDWIRQLGAQEYPVILVHKPDYGNASVTFSYAGFIGCVSGMNDRYMAFGEMGYGSPPGESLEGIPFVFLYRKLMREADNLDDVIRIISEARRTCSYVYVISDAKTEDHDRKALLFVSDRDRVEFYPADTPLVDERNAVSYPAIKDVVYGGAKSEELYDQLMSYHGRISPETLMEIAKPVALRGNVQNVIFKPATLEAWVTNAATAGRDEEGMAVNQKWYYFDFGAALR
jgi:isopenicillin-N N-acyltransferase like protein